MKQLLVSAISLLAISAPAFAADYIEPAPTVYDWSGPYIGVQGGWGWGETIHNDTAGLTSGTFDMDGFLVGGTLGWNQQMDSLVFGLETDLSFSGIDGDTANPICGPGGCSTDIDWLGTGRLRIGYAFDQVLLFAAGGVAFGGVDANCCGGFSTSDTNVGWTAGGGMEWGMSPNMSLKLEYLFVDLGDVTIPTPAPVTADVDQNHIVRAGINWNF